MIKLSEELRKVYLNEELNLQFNEFFLEESVEIQPVAESVQKT